jgi:uncharacterized LabA/DUF88 family protein
VVSTAPRRPGRKARTGGDYLSGVSLMTLRTVLFLDYHNVYRGARETFHGNQGYASTGQIDPMRLGRLLVTKSRDRNLTEVRVYRGVPEATKQPKAYGANRRQVAAWEQAGATVITRALRYPADWPMSREEEKGIDVAIAVDFVAMAVRNEYDRAILMSTDTDLKPALEAVAALSTGVPKCEVAAWSSPDPTYHSRRLSIAGTKVWCHWLTKDDYQKATDPTNYLLP